MERKVRIEMMQTSISFLRMIGMWPAPNPLKLFVTFVVSSAVAVGSLCHIIDAIVGKTLLIY